MTIRAAPRLVEQLRELGNARYHHRHPFNLLMHAGRLTADDLCLWVANRYYYQTRIPIKDALILAKAEDPDFRRVWVRRLLDHDGDEMDQGGLARWLRLGRAVGLSCDDLAQQRLLLPAVKRACDDYVELVRMADLTTAVASSLTEYFAGDIMQTRIAAWKQHYPWVNHDALDYFEKRVVQSARDADFAVTYVAERAVSAADQQRCLGAFARKCEILWRMLDAIYVARRRALFPRLTQRASLTAKKSDGPRLLLAPEKALELNASAEAVLERARGDRSLGQIVTDLAGEFDLPVSRVELDLATFVAELERRRLLVFEAASG